MSADERVQSMPPGSVTHVGSFSWPTGVGPVPFLGDAAPAGWYMLKPGQGFQLEAIADYPTLFDMFGVRFGGDGLTTFGLPQAGLFTRGPDGTHALWSTFGEDAHTLTQAELPAFDMAVDVTAPVGDLVSFDGGGPYNITVSPGGNDSRWPTVHGVAHSGGADAPHNNVAKTLVVNLIIKT